MISKNSSVAQKNITNFRLFVLFVLLILANTRIFGQSSIEVLTLATSTEVCVSKDASIVISSENKIDSTTMDFAVWFTGTKNNFSDNKTKGGFSKKQLINSGVNTNSVLIKSILKKVSCQGNGIA